jgi:4'-phosphopantetheinyl transferase
MKADEVHVWQARLNLSDSVIVACWDLLSSDERIRAKGYHFECDKRRFIVGRGLLRKLLGGYTGQRAVDLLLQFNRYGKPTLDASYGLQFNLSHSHEIVVYAFAAREIGVDVERLQPMDDALNIAERFFSASEVAALKSVSEASRMEAFFTCWTRKEAYIKARGEGLSMPLDTFSVSLERDVPTLEYHDDDLEDGNQWSLANLDVEEGYTGVLAVQGENNRIIQDWYAP